MLKVEPLFENFGGLILSKGDEDQIVNYSPQEIRNMLKTHGAIVFRAFKMNLEKFKICTDLYSKTFLTHMAKDLRASMSEDNTIAGVVKGDSWIYLHGEMYYHPIRPELLWLYCEVPAAMSGETTICDSTALWHALRPHTRKLFEEKKVRYTQTVPKERWLARGSKTIQEAMEVLRKRGVTEIKVGPDNSVISTYITSALAVAPNGKIGFINSIANMGQYSDRIKVDFEDGSSIDESILREICECDERIAKRHRWLKNDVLVVDNAWVMHGRRPFNGERIIYTRFSMAA